MKRPGRLSPLDFARAKDLRSAALTVDDLRSIVPSLKGAGLTRLNADLTKGDE